MYTLSDMQTSGTGLADTLSVFAQEDVSVRHEVVLVNSVCLS